MTTLAFDVNSSGALRLLEGQLHGKESYTAVDVIGRVSRRRKFDNVTFLGVIPGEWSHEGGEKSEAELQVTVDTVETSPIHAPLCTVGSFVHIRGVASLGDRGSVDVKCSELELRRCSPEPNSVDRVLRAVVAGLLGREEAKNALGCSSPEGRLDELLSLCEERDEDGKPQGGETNPKRLRHELSAQARLLQGKPVKRSRQRGPRIPKADLDILANIVSEAGSVIQFPPRVSCRLTVEVQGTAAEASEDGLLHVPGGNPDAPSSRGSMTRGEYVHGRKAPQVAWVVHRLAALLSQTGLTKNEHIVGVGGGHEDLSLGIAAALPNPRLHIVDVGGGRGDLALGIAVALPNLSVTVVDNNPVSLAAGQHAAAERGVAGRLNFVCADFSDFSDGFKAKVDGVVCLHGCGGLSDHALTFAVSQKVPFVVVPCCYLKHPWASGAPWTHMVPHETVSEHFQPQQEDSLGASSPDLPHRLRVVCRLCESDERATSFQAMLTVSSLRIEATARALGSSRSGWQLNIEAFPKIHSLRNLALVGERCDLGGISPDVSEVENPSDF